MGLKSGLEQFRDRKSLRIAKGPFRIYDLWVGGVEVLTQTASQKLVHPPSHWFWTVPKSTFTDGCGIALLMGNLCPWNPIKQLNSTFMRLISIRMDNNMLTWSGEGIRDPLTESDKCFLHWDCSYSFQCDPSSIDKTENTQYNGDCRTHYMSLQKTSYYTDWLCQVQAPFVRKAHLQVIKWNECNATNSGFAYELHLFGQFCASQKVKTIEGKVFSLLDAVSHCVFHTKGTKIYFPDRLLMGQHLGWGIAKDALCNTEKR